MSHSWQTEQGRLSLEYFASTLDFIASEQQVDGLIPWFTGGHADPWDHVESAMGLSIGNRFSQAQHAYLWLQRHQLDDGSWWSSYPHIANNPENRRETNFVAYVATGVWHHYCITQDKAFLNKLWPTVRRAIDFVLRLQTEHGDIHWAINPDGSPKEDALLTGCSSIYKSLACAYAISQTIGEPQSRWRQAQERLGHCLRYKPERFDRTWPSKARYAMDWFYPILAGVHTKQEAIIRLNQRWPEFVLPNMGTRCVTDQPWVTVAESCELVLALLAAGDAKRATTVFQWLQQWRCHDGSYWTGYQFAEDLFWPDEKPTWTAGAILLAADALTQHTAACHLFTQTAD